MIVGHAISQGGLSISSHAFNPLSDPDLDYWWDPYTITQSGGLMTGWIDRKQSINLAGVTSHVPTYETGVWGTPTVYSSGTQALRTTANVTFTRPYALIVSMAASIGGAAWELSGNATGGGIWCFTSSSAPGLLNAAGASSSTWSVFNFTPVQSSGFEIDIPKVYVHWVGTTNATHKLYVNGYALNTSSTSWNNDPGSGSNTDRLNVLARNNGASSYVPQGRVGDIFVVRNPTTAKINKYIAFAQSRAKLVKSATGAIYGDSLVSKYPANDVGMKNVAVQIYGTALDPVLCRVGSYSVAGQKVQEQESIWNIGAAGIGYTPKSWSGLQWIFIMCGLNNWIQDLESISTVLGRVQTFTTNVRNANSSVKIYLGTWTPMYDYLINVYPGSHAAKLAEWQSFNSGLSSITGKDRVISGYLTTLDQNPSSPTYKLAATYESSLNDHLHMSGAGKTKIADAIVAEGLIPDGIY
jgi:hypothetical protein